MKPNQVDEYIAQRQAERAAAERLRSQREALREDRKAIIDRARSLGKITQPAHDKTLQLRTERDHINPSVPVLITLKTVESGQKVFAAMSDVSFFSETARVRVGVATDSDEDRTLLGYDFKGEPVWGMWIADERTTAGQRDDPLNSNNKPTAEDLRGVSDLHSRLSETLDWVEVSLAEPDLNPLPDVVAA